MTIITGDRRNSHASETKAGVVFSRAAIAFKVSASASLPICCG